MPKTQGARAGLPALVFAVVLAACAPPAQADLADAEVDLRDTLYARQETMVGQLRTWVDHNTGSWNTSGLAVFADMTAARLAELGFEITVEGGRPLQLPGHQGELTGPIVLGRYASASPGAPAFLLVGHMDTVFDPDSPFQSFELDPDDADRGRGPGVVDMKGGLVVLFEVLRALRETGDLERATWTVLLNSDEEIGSLGSRPTIEREATLADYGLVFEPPRFSGAMTMSRSGIGQFHLSVEGRAAHSGSAHASGRNAILDLADKVLRLEQLTDYEQGRTVNVGTIEGGTNRNVVAAHAEAWIDLRFQDERDGELLRQSVESIASAPYVEGTTTTVWGVLHRPPKPASDVVHDLLRQHAEICSELGFELPPPEHSGGGTDGSIMAGEGLPTLDTMGPEGSHVHTDREYIVLSSLSKRAAATAILLRRLIQAGPQE